MICVDCIKQYIEETVPLEIERARQEGYRRGVDAATPGWRPVSEKPATNGKYIIRFELEWGGIFYADSWHDRQLGWLYNGIITHWMPIPEVDTK